MFTKYGNKVIHRILRHAGFRIERIENKSSIEDWLSFRHFLALYFSKVDTKDFFFVQVGANDGKSTDPLYEFVIKYDLSGVLIEPQKDLIKKLKKNYEGCRKLKIAEVAVGEKTGERILYSVKKQYWSKNNFPRIRDAKTIDDDLFESKITGMASFDKDTFVKTLRNKLNPGTPYEEYIDEILVETLTLNSLIERFKIEKIDFLQIDCQGYDYEIVKLFDFDRFEPSIVNYEVKHLSFAKREECKSLLRERGYELFRHGQDVCAFKS